MSGDDRHRDETPAELAERRAKLDRRIADTRSRHAPPAPKGSRGSGGMQGMAQGLKIASEFVAGILVGTAIGYGFDSLFGTGPFGLIFFLMIGFAAGVLNVIRGSSVTPPGDAAAEATKKDPAGRE